MSFYDRNRQWSDLYIDEIKRIIGPYVLDVSSFDQDVQEATDLIVIKAGDFRIACRVRRPGFFPRYRYDFTVRSLNGSGSQTELDKIYSGWASMMFYGHAEHGDAPVIKNWMLVDLNAFRYHCIANPDRVHYKSCINSEDGNHFAVFDIRHFVGDPKILIASQGILER